MCADVPHRDERGQQDAGSRSARPLPGRRGCRNPAVTDPGGSHAAIISTPHPGRTRTPVLMHSPEVQRRPYPCWRGVDNCQNRHAGRRNWWISHFLLGLARPRFCLARRGQRDRHQTSGFDGNGVYDLCKNSRARNGSRRTSAGRTPRKTECRGSGGRFGSGRSAVHRLSEEFSDPLFAEVEADGTRGSAVRSNGSSGRFVVPGFGAARHSALRQAG
jgi:hypothetical protein